MRNATLAISSVFVLQVTEQVGNVRIAVKLYDHVQEAPSQNLGQQTGHA